MPEGDGEPEGDGMPEGEGEPEGEGGRDQICIQEARGSNQVKMTKMHQYM